MRKEQMVRWATSDETNFLNGLGTWCRSTTLPRKELLENFLTSARQRDEWGDVDKSKAIRYAEGMLRAI